MHEYAAERETVHRRPDVHVSSGAALRPVARDARARAPTGATLVFSSDVAPCAELVDAARDADLFLCESALLDASQDEADPRPRGHMTAAEAGAAAAARRRATTADHPLPLGRAARRAPPGRGAQPRFGGPVELAREGETFTVV